MQVAYLHVVINHLPIMGVPIALAVLALGAWARSASVQRAALLLLVGLGVATIAVYAAGQGGEDFVEHLPGVAEDAIEAHEDMAGIALGATLGLAALALVVFLRGGGVALLRRRDDAARAVPAWGTGAVLLAGIVVAGVLGYTGKLGGQIRHVEFVDGAVAHDDDAHKDSHDDARERDDDDGRGGRGRH
jgi:uncharacterized membrane protein